MLTRLASLNLVQPGDGELVDLFDAELAGESDPDVRLAIEAAQLDALLTVPERHAERARLVAAIDVSRAADPLLQRVVLAHRAWVGIELGTAGAATGATLALEALEGGLLLADAHRRRAYAICARVLMAADHPEAGAVILALRDEAVRRGSLRLRVAAAWYAAEHALRVGRVGDAESSARLALELVDEGLNTFTGGAIEVLVRALAERGAFDEAHELLRSYGLDGALGMLPWQISVRHARARLALAEGDYELAHAEAVKTGTLRAAQGRPNPSLAPWRSTAALALAHLGRRDEAAAWPRPNLPWRCDSAHRCRSPARSMPAPSPNPTPPRASRCASARWRWSPRCRGFESRAGCGWSSAMRWRTSAIASKRVRRCGRRWPTRTRRARCCLAERARRELVATGLRPRNAALEGMAALTPRQRQICELAAVGKGNRAIAQELFLSVKTVETHLAAGYRKLGVTHSGGVGGGAARRPRRAAWTSRIGLVARPAERRAPRRRVGWWWRRARRLGGALPLGELPRESTLSPTGHD